MTIQDIAKVLVEKNKLPQAEAEAFVAAIFDVVEAGIERDKLVKIKGLGTFKVVTVDARESVNVNTGERVIIDSHDKITFTPDAMMKELVNKPFSSFETVVLNEGVEFEDMPVQEDNEQTEVSTADEETPKTVEQEEVVAEMPKTVEQEEVIGQDTTTEVVKQEKEEEAPKAEQPEQKVEHTAPEHEVTPIVFNTTEEQAPATLKKESAPATEEKPTSISFEENIEEAHKDITTTQNPLWQWIVLALACLCIGFGAGFYTHQYMSAEPTIAEQPESEIVTDTIAKASEQQELKTDTIATDTLKKPVTTPVPETKPQVKNEDVDYLKYDAMDTRVEKGAYYIIGTQSVVQAREGDNVAKLSRRYLGEGMSCYVEVYNGMKATTQLNAGQEIKIPKLITKKTLKARLKQQQQKQKENQQ